MKILYLENPKVDYGSAMLYDGLCKVLGEKNVIDYPLKDLFHGTSPWPYIIDRDSHHYDTDEMILKDMNSFDVLVLASTREVNIAKLREWIANKIDLPPIVLIDQDEPTELDMLLINEFNPICSFKREYLLDREYPNNCFPLPFSSSYPLIHQQNLVHRPIDVYACMMDTHPKRRWVDYTIRQLSHMGFHYEGNFHRPYETWYDYIEKFSQAKIGIAIRGFGCDTNRFLEVIASHCLLITDELHLIKPYPFIHKKHCVYFEDGNLGWHISHYLHPNSINERQQIATQGFNHLFDYHTTDRRAMYFLDIIEEFLKGQPFEFNPRRYCFPPTNSIIADKQRGIKTIMDGAR